MTFPRIWIFNLNRRVYRKRNGRPYGPPIWIEHWEEAKVAGETSRSWVTNTGVKVPKKLKQIHNSMFCFSLEEIEERAWIKENAHKIADAVQRVNSYEILKTVAEIVGYRESECQS
jgi:hypothetical protein